MILVQQATLLKWTCQNLKQKKPMPFKSKQQMKLCFKMNSPKWDCKKWLKETKKAKTLPNKKKK